MPLPPPPRSVPPHLHSRRIPSPTPPISLLYQSPQSVFSRVAPLKMDGELWSNPTSWPQEGARPPINAMMLNRPEFGADYTTPEGDKRRANAPHALRYNPLMTTFTRPTEQYTVSCPNDDGARSSRSGSRRVSNCIAVRPVTRTSENPMPTSTSDGHGGPVQGLARRGAEGHADIDLEPSQLANDRTGFKPAPTKSRSRYPSIQ